MNSEPELSAEARRVIASAEGFDDPTNDDRQRVKTRWLASIATAASVSSLGEVARAASSTGWGIKAAGFIVALAAGAVGVYALMPSAAPTSPAEPAQQPSLDGRARLTAPAPSEDGVVSAKPPAAESAPVVAAPEARMEPAEMPTPELPAVAPARRPPTPVVPALRAGVPSSPSTRAGSPEVASVAPETEVTPVAAFPEAEEAPPEVTPVAAPAAEPVQSSRQLGEETLLLSQIRRSLQQGAAAQALVLLSEYRGRFEKPLLGMEAAALRVDALCQSGNVEAGRAEAELFQATWPSSPLERRVRAACR